MAWTINWTSEAQATLAKIDRQIARRIRDYFVRRVAKQGDARGQGKPLRGGLREYWRYRVGDYRVICDIQDESSRIIVVCLGHRKNIYR